MSDWRIREKKHAASFVPAHRQNKLRVIACGPLRPALAVPRASAAGMGFCNDAHRNNSTAAKAQRGANSMQCCIGVT
jgi:hypothetical protein